MRIFNCIVCKEKKKVIDSRIHAKYCSNDCKGIAYQNRRHTDATKEKCRISKLGDKNPEWRGENVGYKALHQWVSRQKGKAMRCSYAGYKIPCGKTFEWANISHQYKRDLKDWLSLCNKHHKLYDKGRSDRNNYFEASTNNRPVGKRLIISA